MKYRIFLLFILVGFNLFAEGNNAKVLIPKGEIVTLNKRILEIEQKYSSDSLLVREKLNSLGERQNYQSGQIDSQTGMIDTAFDGVSAEIGASSNYISVLGIIIAILSIGLGIYITRIEKSIKQMNSDSETMVIKNIQIKESVEALSEKITKDSKGLYSIIRNEESNHLLDRLISVPEDISNLFSSIASRDLENIHFQKLKEAYLQIKNDGEFKTNYLTLFFQHFSGLSILDADLKSDFINAFDSSFKNAYKNDLIKSVKDLFTSIGEQDLSKFKDEINIYVKHLCKHKYGQMEEIYFEINKVLDDRDLKFRLYKEIEKSPETILFRKIFGKMILDYNYEDLTVSENEVIKDIKSIIK